MFINFNNKTHYSILYGFLTPEELVREYKRLGAEAVCITDSCLLSGAMDFLSACKQEKMKPILGLEVLWTPDISSEKDISGNRGYPITLIAKNNNGYHNLIKISSESWVNHPCVEGLDFPYSRVNNALLSLYSEDIICLTGNEFSFPIQAIKNNKRIALNKFFDFMKETFKDFYCQVPYPTTNNIPVIRELLSAASSNKVPVVMSGHALVPNDKELVDAYFNKAMTRQKISLHSKKTDSKDYVLSNHITKENIENNVILSEKEVLNLINNFNLPYDLIENSEKILQLITSDYLVDRKNRYPKFQELPEGVTSWQALENMTQWLLAKKFSDNIPEVYSQRLKQELYVIKKMGFSDYMLIVWDYLEKIREQGVIVGPGRGSACGSLIAYLLNITSVDPIEYDLLFTRFLNPGRAATPLIFSKESRTKALKVVQDLSLLQ